MNAISPARRLAIAAASLAISAALFRGPMASALVTRGDDAAAAGDEARAERAYARALAIDDSPIAADRLAFLWLRRHDAADDERAIGLATHALAAAPTDAALLADRGLAERRRGRLAAAQGDFAAAGALAHDARYEHFAGRVALARGLAAQARAYFATARRDDPRFAPARAEDVR